MTGTHSGPSASEVVRGAREAEALPEELRSRQFLPQGRKLQFIVVEGLAKKSAPESIAQREGNRARH